MTPSLLAHGAASGTDAIPPWQPAPLVIVGAAIALGLFWQAFARLRRRGRSDLAPWWRLAAFVAGVTLGVLAVISPLDGVAEEQLVSAHMLQHVLVGDLVPALLVVAVSGPLIWLSTPRPLLRAVHRAPRLRVAVAFVTRPAASFAIWAGAIAVWHVPAAYEAALAQPLLHDLEHATFFLGGILVWLQLVDPARRRALSPLGRIGYAVCLLAAGGALVNVLVFGNALYPSYASAGERVLDLGPAADQQAAGMVMLVEQWLTVGAFVVVVIVRRTSQVVGTGRPLAAGEHPLSL